MRKILENTLKNPFFRGIVLTIFVVGLTVIANRFFFKEQVKSSKAIFLGNEEIDKIFTMFAYVSLIHTKQKYLKRDFLKNFFPEDLKIKKEMVVSGYCQKDYYVGFGYNETYKILKKYANRVCDGKFQNLPPPKILTKEMLKSNQKGNYSRLECDGWDMDGDNPKSSRKQIKTQLLHDGVLKEIYQKSKDILKSYILIFCSD